MGENSKHKHLHSKRLQYSEGEYWWILFIAFFQTTENNPVGNIWQNNEENKYTKILDIGKWKDANICDSFSRAKHFCMMSGIIKTVKTWRSFIYFIHFAHFQLTRTVSLLAILCECWIAVPFSSFFPLQQLLKSSFTLHKLSLAAGRKQSARCSWQ